MDIKITKSNEDVFTLKSLGLMATDFIVSKPEIETETVDLSGRHGEHIMERKYKRRTIRVPFYAFIDSSDFPNKRDEIFSLLIDTKSFYAEEFRGGKSGYEFTAINEQPNPIDDYNFNVTGKRYTVHLLDLVNLNEENGFVEGEVLLETIETPFAESVNIIKRRYRENAFTFKNSGTEIIDMGKQTETEIIFKGVSSSLKIENLTTGAVWEYNGATSANDEIKLKGVRSLKNDVSIFGNTNKKIINFAPGNNKFKISGASGAFELKVATRFYFI